LRSIRAAAIDALVSPVFGEVACEVVNTVGGDLRVTITIAPPASTPQALQLSRSAGAWKYQGASPAHSQVRPKTNQWREGQLSNSAEVMTDENGAPVEF
jgi:hypothetical protein